MPDQATRPPTCPNCGQELPHGEKFCRRCGTARNGDRFDPQKNIMQPVYGPMPLRRIKSCFSALLDLFRKS